MEKITLTKESKLIETYWHYDETSNQGSYKTKEIDFISAHYLHEKYCELEEGLTLKHIFNFMLKHIDFLDLYLGNWCAEIVAEGLKVNDISELKIESDHLELYWTIDKRDNQIYFPNRMDLHGKNKEESFSLMFCSANDLADILIKINPSLILYNDEDDTKNLNLGNFQPTLFHILYGIVWELSFLGNPEKRNEEKLNLEEIISEIKEGESKCMKLTDWNLSSINT